MSDYLAGLHLLPEHMRASMAHWIEQGVPHPSRMGGFEYAVLTNDLIGAFAHADFQNRRAMYEWTVFLWHYAPAGCHGSEANLLAWYAAHHPDKATPLEQVHRPAGEGEHERDRPGEEEQPPDLGDLGIRGERVRENASDGDEHGNESVHGDPLSTGSTVSPGRGE